MSNSGSKEPVIRNEKRPGWVRIHNEIIDEYGAQLGAYGVAVYLVLCRRRDFETQQVLLSERDIARTLGISQDRVRKSLRELESLSLIGRCIPRHPGPGVIGTITLLDTRPRSSELEPCARTTLTSGYEPNVTRSTYKEENKTRSNTPLTPLSRRGYQVTVRDRRELNSRIYALQQPCGRPGDPDYRPALDFDTAVNTACGQMFISVEAGRALANAAGLEIEK